MALRTLLPLVLIATLCLPCGLAQGEDAPGVAIGITPARFGAGPGPTTIGEGNGAWRLLAPGVTHQSNAIALDASSDTPPLASRAALACKLRVLEGGDGGAFVFLNTREHGTRGPAPFCKSWVEPNLSGSFAVGIDVHNPPDREMFSAWGNYQDLPQREISLHFDGREIVKRVAPKEFRGDFADVEIAVDFVAGGAEVSVVIAGGTVYDRFFMAHMHAYPMRLAIGAGTRAKATTEFDVKDFRFQVTDSGTQRRRPPVHVEVFNHVLTNNKKTSYSATVDLPPANWAFERVVLTLDIHDAGKDWDEWDRNGHLYLLDDAGKRLDIVPFITSYRTTCHWKVDVTHFRPLLAGKRTFEIHAGTTFYKNRGYMMSVSLDFHHGTAKEVPTQVIPLWHGTAHYRSAENHFQDFFTPQTVTIPEGTTSARIATTTTGHSQVGEFTPSKRAIVVAPKEGKEGRFENTLWKTDVYLNPNRPQFGTWKFSRAGWAPGDIVHPWWIDASPHVSAGGEVTIRYEPSAYDFSGAPQTPGEKEINKASHVVRSFLILYGDPGQLVSAPILLITNVQKDSNAAKAGVKRGDYLASYNNVRLDSVDDLRAAIQSSADIEGKINAVVYRGAQRIEIQLDPGTMGINLGSR